MEHTFTISSKTQFDIDTYQLDMIAFEELKQEIVIGHKAIHEGKVTLLQDVRKEFGLY